MLHPSRRLLAALFALVMVFAVAACSDDDSSDGGSSADPTDAAAGDTDPESTDTGDDDVDPDETEFDLNEITGGDDRPFDIDRETLARSLAPATKADRWEIDGDTIRLIYDSGSASAVTSTINCTAANTLKSDEDQVVLVYPDGEVDCGEYSSIGG